MQTSKVRNDNLMFPIDIYDIVNSENNIRTVSEALKIIKNAASDVVIPTENHSEEVFVQNDKNIVDLTEDEPNKTDLIFTKQCAKDRVFCVLYGVYKPYKKHKVWSEDGVLLASSLMVTLFDNQGKILGSTGKLPELIEDGTRIVVGDKEVEIQYQLDMEEFISKSCFSSE